MCIRDRSYDAGAKPNVEITGGGGTGGAAEVIVNGHLESFDVLTEGTGYTEAPLVSIVGGGGSGATAQAVITGGRVTRILVEQPGTGYTSQPSVSIQVVAVMVLLQMLTLEVQSLV